MDELELTPQFRVEYFLDAIVNSTDCPYEARDRIELFLERIAGADIVTPEPMYRIEFYLAKIAGDDVEIPEPQHRAEFYLAAICGEDVELPDPHDRIDYWLYQWAQGGGMPDWQTFTGNPLTFNAPKAHVLKSVKVEFSPIQSGSGDPSPDNVRPISGWTGATVWDEHDYDPTATPKLNLTWQDEAGMVYGGYLLFNEDGSVDLVGEWVSVDASTLSFTLKNNTANRQAWVGFVNRIKPADSLNSVINALCSEFKPVSNNDTWLPYCIAPNASGIAFPDAVFCFPSNAYASEAEVQTALTGVQLCYELATPVIYHLPSLAEALTALQGLNVMWTDGDTLTVEARGESVQLNALQSLNMLLGGRYVNNHGADDLTDEEALNVILGGQR